MAKGSRETRSFVRLQSSESDHCYYVEKNRNNTKVKLEIKKYDPTLRKHVLYREGRMG